MRDDDDGPGDGADTGQGLVMQGGDARLVVAASLRPGRTDSTPALRRKLRGLAGLVVADLVTTDWDRMGAGTKLRLAELLLKHGMVADEDIRGVGAAAVVYLPPLHDDAPGEP